MQIELTPAYLASQDLPLTFPARFWAKVMKTDHCWLWIGSVNNDGYGLMARGPRGLPHIKAHRASWILHFGPIPVGKEVCHDCHPIKDNPACINPDHLWLGTRSENMIDAVNKHGAAGISWGGRTNLTVEQVKEIRAIYALGGFTQTELARKFNTYPSKICRIVNHVTWPLIA